MYNVFLSILVLLSFAVSACNTESKARPYADLTASEKARIALDAKDFETAINLYKELIASDPLDYESYRFLSTAYAEQGGFDILKAVAGTLGGGSANLLKSIGSFLPDDPTDAQIESIRLSTEILLSLPVERRSYDHPEVPTASSGAQQLEFYQTAYSVIYINKFTQVSGDGTLDPTKLDTMTDADVDNILNNFEAIAAASGEGQSDIVAKGAEEFISQLDGTPGDTRREKLVNYLATHSK